MKPFRYFLALLLSLLALTGCSKPAPISQNAFLMDTVITITLYDSTDTALLEQTVELCAEYERLFSRTLPESEVYRLNHAGGQPVAVSADTLLLVQTAVAYSELTGGKYDITICPVVDLWDFTGDAPSLPAPTQLRQALAAVDYHNIVVQGNTIQLKNGAQIDLGSIAKGYIADRLAEFLAGQGVQSAIINLGGNIMTVGGKPSGEPFQIGIQKPFEQHSETVGSVQIRGQSVVSSGIYERSFVLDGTRYHHILDPATGYPADSGLVAVTVVSDHSMDGDALSTGLFLLGLTDGLALAERLPGVEAMFIAADGAEHRTSGFAADLQYKPSQGV